MSKKAVKKSPPKPPAAPKAPDPAAALLEEMSAEVEDRLEANRTADTPALEGVGGGHLKGAFGKLSKAVVAAFMKANEDGKLDRSDLVDIAVDAITRLLAKKAGMP